MGNCEEKLEYNFDGIASYLEKKYICTLEDAYMYLEAEDKFCDLKGINVYDDEQVLSLDEIVCDDDELIHFVADHTSIDILLVARINAAIWIYMLDNGFVMEEVD